MNPSEVMGVLEERGALIRGHFQLSSGRHSDQFVQKFRVLEQPRLAQTIRRVDRRCVRSRLRCRSEPSRRRDRARLRDGPRGRRSVRLRRARGRGDAVPARVRPSSPGERTLVVEDVITTGGSAGEIVELVRAAGAEPVGCGGPHRSR